MILELIIQYIAFFGWCCIIVGCEQIFDGIISIILQYDQEWYYHPGRVFRVPLGLFILILGVELLLL